MVGIGVFAVAKTSANCPIFESVSLFVMSVLVQVVFLICQSLDCPLGFFGVSVGLL